MVRIPPTEHPGYAAITSKSLDWRGYLRRRALAHRQARRIRAARQVWEKAPVNVLAP